MRGLLLSAVIIAAVSGCAFGVTAAGTDAPFCLEPGDTCRVEADTLARGVTAEVRAAVTSNPSRGDAAWGVTLNDAAGAPMLRGEITWGGNDYDDTFGQRSLLVTLYRRDGRGWSECVRASLPAHVDLHRGPNSLSVDASDGVARFSVGSDLLQYAASAPYPRRVASIDLTANRPLKVKYFVKSETPDPAIGLQTTWTRPALDEYFASPDTPGAPVGYWTYLDRDINPQWAVPGGFYTLAIVPADGGYDLIYVDGAKTNDNLWHTGMIKGRMRPTAFMNHYSLQWYDASLTEAGPECSADITDGAILTLNFPLHHAIMRYAFVRR